MKTKVPVPNPVALGGSLIGFGAGKLIEVPLKPIFNNVRNEYGNIPVIYPWITTGKPKSPIPGTVGGLGASVGTEVAGKYMENKVKDMRNDKINLIMFVYLMISCALAMFFLFFLLNLMFSIIDFLREGEFNFTWETAIDCFTLGAITGPIAALGIWFMLRFRM